MPLVALVKICDIVSVVFFLKAIAYRSIVISVLFLLPLAPALSIRSRLRARRRGQPGPAADFVCPARLRNRGPGFRSFVVLLFLFLAALLSARARTPRLAAPAAPPLPVLGLTPTLLTRVVPRAGGRGLPLCVSKRLCPPPTVFVFVSCLFAFHSARRRRWWRGARCVRPPSAAASPHASTSPRAPPQDSAESLQRGASRLQPPAWRARWGWPGAAPRSRRPRDDLPLLPHAPYLVLCLFFLRLSSYSVFSR